ncbi:ATP-dependent helicase [Thalassospira xiamenensis]|uniref:DNA 3'-5' helicase n=1 Tax=Thalassospira xiamenensis TaxID=220697 RepID=A0A285R5K5_9PROT|nr:ATP-dependent helicase [Thalassospira xiamenensis]SOB89371.1 Superfamily I DNA or RNA helicase [Thalassospira xiamenensis]
MKTPSQEQSAIIDAPLDPISVVACAGSGKTYTVVRRLAEVQQKLDSQRGRVALLSFSNVAVDTFRRNYNSLTQKRSVSTRSNRVEIETLDGFITRNVLRPHAHRTMQASQTAFLVSGREPFLSGFNVSSGDYPISITDVKVGLDQFGVNFYWLNNNQKKDLNREYTKKIVDRLGKSGAYTHDLGRYWCYRTLKEQPTILRALARRYSHILIDEAQDIGAVHQKILELLISKGTKVSLIGDPNQGIYEFAGADGGFLARYGKRPGVIEMKLTCNYRSVPSIVDLANKLSDRDDDPDRCVPKTKNGAFFIPYKATDLDNLVHTFQTAVLAAKLDIEKSAIICRGNSLAEKLAGHKTEMGQGIVKQFALAAIARDKKKDYFEAFKTVVACIAGLMVDLPRNWVASVVQPAQGMENRSLRRLIWYFTRNHETGLPCATLEADTEWHRLLRDRVTSLISMLEKDFDLKPVDNIGRKLAKRGLTNSPLVAAKDLHASSDSAIRVDTVHQVKGESLDAVLYVTKKEHVVSMLAGTGSEVGRIGYVAVTRAKNLLWLAVPSSSLSELRTKLIAHGFQEVK